MFSGQQKKYTRFRPFPTATVFRALSILFALALQVPASLVQNVAVDGSANLLETHFSKDIRIELTGGWSFCWDTLGNPGGASDCVHPRTVRVPSAWNRMPEWSGLPARGVATYRLRLLLPKSYRPALELRVPPMSTASRLYVNGEEMGASGFVSSSPDRMRAALDVYHVLLPDTDVVDLVLQVSNRDHYKGGAWKPILLAAAPVLSDGYRQDVFARVFLAGLLLMMGVYHAVLWFYRRKEKEHLVFAAIAVCGIGRLLLPGDHILGTVFGQPWDWSVRMEYILLSWTLPLFHAFARELYRNDIPLWAMRVLIVSALLYLPFGLVAPLPLLTASQSWLQVLNILFPLPLLYGLWGAGRKGRRGAMMQFVLLVLVYAAATCDILQARQMVQWGYWFSYALVLFIFAQWLLLASRFSRAYLMVERQMESFLLTLASAIESRDRFTGGHVDRVANYSRDLAMALRLPPEDVSLIYLGAVVHDVGKISVPEKVLNKPARLEDDENKQIRKHPAEGFRLLSRIEGMQVASQVALRHQERWNGSGYPDGLSGESIPLAARIVAIADCWDAITSDRPYRRAMTLEEAVQLMRRMAGKELDPELVRVFLEHGVYSRYLIAHKDGGGTHH